MRLDKYLADCGVGTRSEVKVYLKKGLVTLNGEKAVKGDLKITEGTDVVCFQGEQVQYQKNRNYMLNKPAGVVSAVTDNLHRTVIDLLDVVNKQNLFPVGRLDIDTEGLLLLTDDGPLSHELLSPKKHVDKTYYAVISGLVTEEDVIKFREGLSIGEKKNTLPGELVILKAGETSEITLTIHEGKFHQVKRMFEAVGKKVTYLKRLSMGSLVLDEALAPGEYRELTEIEVTKLKDNRYVKK